MLLPRYLPLFLQATIDGFNLFGLSGNAVRALAGDYGMDLAPSGAAFAAATYPIVYLAGTTDFRHAAFVAAGESSPQLLAAYSASATSCGLYSIGPGGEPMASVSWTQQINGGTGASGIGMGSFVGFVVQDVYTIWALSSTALYKLVSTSNATRPTPNILGQTWGVAPGYPQTPSVGNGLRYITGRSEGGSYVLYVTTETDVTANEAYLIRHVPGTAGFNIMTGSGVNKLMRGLFLPPCDEAINGPCGVLSPPPFPTPSVTPTATSSLTASASTTASSSTTASFTNTPTLSKSAGSTSSITSSLTASPSASATVAPYKFLTSSIVVLRLGTGDAIPVTNLAQPLFLDEYAIGTNANGSTVATVIRTVPLPSDAGWASCTGTIPGVSPTNEGGGSNSWDGRFITLPCSAGPVGTANVYSTTYGARHVARINAASDVKMVEFTDPNTANLRGAASINGLDMWSQSGGSVRYLQAPVGIDDPSNPSGTLFTSPLTPDVMVPSGAYAGRQNK